MIFKLSLAMLALSTTLVQETNACSQVSTACKQAYVNAVLTTINYYRVLHKVSPVKLTTNQTLISQVNKTVCDLADQWRFQDRYTGGTWLTTNITTTEMCAGKKIKPLEYR
jgi:hypothetical protein